MAAEVEVIDRGWRALLDSLKTANNSFSKVGYPGEDAKVHSDSGLTMASLAATHEYGSPANGIPPRPFMAQTMQRTSRQLQTLSAQLYKMIAHRQISVKAALARLGEFHGGEIKRTFTSGQFTPLKPATVLRKGSSRPLIDTGQLRNSVTHVEVINAPAGRA